MKKRKSQGYSVNECEDSNNQELLQAMDENNTEWVEAWKQTAKKRIKC